MKEVIHTQYNSWERKFYCINEIEIEITTKILSVEKSILKQNLASKASNLSTKCSLSLARFDHIFYVVA